MYSNYSNSELVAVLKCKALQARLGNKLTRKTLNSVLSQRQVEFVYRNNIIHRDKNEKWNDDLRLRKGVAKVRNRAVQVLQSEFDSLWSIWHPLGKTMERKSLCFKKYKAERLRGISYEAIIEGAEQFMFAIREGRVKEEYCGGLGRWIENEKYTIEWNEVKPDKQSNRSGESYSNSVIGAVAKVISEDGQ